MTSPERTAYLQIIYILHNYAPLKAEKPSRIKARRRKRPGGPTGLQNRLGG